MPLRSEMVSTGLLLLTWRSDLYFIVLAAGHISGILMIKLYLDFSSNFLFSIYLPDSLGTEYT